VPAASATATAAAASDWRARLSARLRQKLNKKIPVEALLRPGFSLLEEQAGEVGKLARLDVRSRPAHGRLNVLGVAEGGRATG
jgi:hypothetical protein